MQLAIWEHRVLLFSISCHGALLWRLWWEKLARLYPFLTMFLSVEMLQNIALLPFRPDSTVYALSYVFSTPVLWVLAWLVVLELYRLILQDYPGIASVGRGAVTWCMGVAVVVSAIYAIPALKTASGQFPILRIYYILERSTVLGLLLFLVLIQLVLVRYRLRISRNRMIYATGYALYFGIGVAQDIIFTALGIRVVPAITLWIVAAAGVILLAAATLLSREGEAPVTLQPVEADSGRARLRQQLVEMNRILSRAAKGP